jgi:NADH-quinone oxidoreductase subunit N
VSGWASAAAGHRWLVASLVVCLLGLVGTPPTAVFVGKLAVFAAAADGALMWLVVVAAVNTVASLFYYLRWIAPATSFAFGEVTDAAVGTGGAAATAQVAAGASLLLGAGAGLWLGIAS